MQATTDQDRDYITGAVLTFVLILTCIAFACIFIPAYSYVFVWINLGLLGIMLMALSYMYILPADMQPRWA